VWVPALMKGVLSDMEGDVCAGLLATDVCVCVCAVGVQTCGVCMLPELSHKGPQTCGGTVWSLNERMCVWATVGCGFWAALCCLKHV
jgi:hypothetical protein